MSLVEVATIDPKIQESIGEVVKEITALHNNDGIRGIVVYIMGEDDETIFRSSSNLSTREVIGALVQLGFEMHLSNINPDS
jgi:hypothetical protein